MKATAAIALVGVALCAAMSRVAAEQALRPQVRNYEAQGNLGSQHELGCIRPDKLSNKLTPADLYRAVSACAKQGKYNESAVLFALAGTYGRFDTLRVSDKSAHQATSVLIMQVFREMQANQQNAFKEHIGNAIGSLSGLAAACKEIARIGPPDYYPGYMVRHGIGAFTKTVADDGLVQNFDAAAAWKQSLDSYLHCPGL